MTEETKEEESLVGRPYDFFATEDYESFGFLTEKGYPMMPQLLNKEDLFFIYQLALMDKEERKECISSIQGLEQETEEKDKPRIQLLH